MISKENLAELLLSGDNSRISEIAGREHGIIRKLMSLTYDKKTLICWRAIEAIGLVSRAIAQTDYSSTRTLVGRLLWTIREESGGIGWSSPEILGEIVRNTPEEFSDIAPILGSFYEEEMLREGVMRALMRIGEVRPDLISVNADFLEECMREQNPAIVIYALLLARYLGLMELKETVESLVGNEASAVIYLDREFRSRSVAETALQSLRYLREAI